MEVICLESEAFYTLVEEVVQRIGAKDKSEKKKWIGKDEAMAELEIKSPTTLQKLRDEGKVRFSQPQKKIILYDRESIYEYLEDNAQNTF